MNAVLEVVAWNTALTALLAVIVAILTSVVRRAPIVHALWTIVLLKLLVPPLLSLNVDMPPLWSTAGDTTAIEMPSADMVATAAIPATPIIAGVDEIDSPSVDHIASVPADVMPYDVPFAYDPAKSMAQVTIPGILLCVWAVGSLLWIGNAWRHVRRFRRLLRQTHPLSGSLQAEALRLSATCGLKRCPELRVVEGCVPPMVWPSWHGPIVVIPADLLAKLDAVQQRTLVAHELAHVRRRDHWWRWLHLATIGIYWWNPVAWFAVRRIQNAEEQCCDAWVVWMLSDSRRDYARTLLDTIDFLSPAPYAMPPQASGLGRLPQLKRRIEMLVQGRLLHRLTGRWKMAVLVFGMALLVFNVQARPAAIQEAERTEAETAPDAKPQQTEPGTTESNVTPDVSKRLEQLEAKIHLLEKQLSETRKTSAESPPVTIMRQVPVGSLQPHVIPNPQPPRDGIVTVGMSLVAPSGPKFWCRLPGHAEYLSATDRQIPFQVSKKSGTATRQICDVKLTAVPGHSDVEVYGQLLVESPNAATAHFLYSQNLRIELSAEEAAKASLGEPIFKVVVLRTTEDSSVPGTELMETITAASKKEFLALLRPSDPQQQLLCALRLELPVTYLGGREKMIDPPTPAEVVKSLPDEKVATNGFLAETRHEMLDLTIEQIVDTTDDVRLYPLVGPAALKKAHFKCTARFREIIESDWPIEFRHDNGEMTQVVYIDHDKLVKPH